MKKSAKNPLYYRIVEDIRHTQRLGNFNAGDRLYSVNEMQEHYNVSSTTAVRAIDELKKLGIVESIRGKGTFFKGISSKISKDYSAKNKIRKISLLVGSTDFFRNGFQFEIYSGIESEAEKAGLMLEVKKFPSANPSQINQLVYEPEEDEGIIIIASKIPVGLYPLLMDNGVRTVLVDGFIPGVPSICTDNFAGINQLVCHLENLGHKHIALGYGFSSSLNQFNENERLAAFNFITKERSIKSQAFISSQHEVILDALKAPGGPTAVIFTQDLAVVPFFEYARNRNMKISEDFSICGFDGWIGGNKKLTDVTTIKVNREGMGREAMRALLDDNIMNNNFVPAVRVSGDLIVGDSSGIAPVR